MVSDTTIEIVKPRLSHRARASVRERSRISLLDVVLSPFWLLGWVVFWVLLLLAETSRLTVAAVRVGWADARERAQSRRIAADRWPVTPRSPRKKAAAGGPG